MSSIVSNRGSHQKAEGTRVSFPASAQELQRAGMPTLGKKERVSMATGTLKKSFFREKGYGFITPDEPMTGGKSDIFVHFSSIQMDGFKTLDEGDRVEFEVGPGKKPGESQAINVRKIG